MGTTQGTLTARFARRVRVRTQLASLVNLRTGDEGRPDCGKLHRAHDPHAPARGVVRPF